MERGRPVGGRAQRNPGLGGERVGLVTGGRCLVGGEVVAGEHARQLVVAERLEIAGRGEMLRATVALGQRLIRDLSNDALDEPVLAAFR